MGELPKPAPRVRPIEDAEFAVSLVPNLRETVDEARQCAAEVGARPYRVYLVWARWSGGTRGNGKLTVDDRHELLPRPKVSDLTGVSQALAAVGIVEGGTTRVSQVSASYTEDLLLGYRDRYMNETTKRARSLAKDVEFWWEIQEQRVVLDTQPEARQGAARPRRFKVAGTPSLSGAGLGWVVTLAKQDYDSGRDGARE